MRLTMNALGPDSDFTRDSDLLDWQAFCLAYYEPIRRAFRMIGGGKANADELTHSFLLKAAEKDFLVAFHAFRGREEKTGRRAQFRNYLYRSLQNHVRDFHRKSSARAWAQDIGPGATGEIEGVVERVLDPDAIYALDILHQAVQALRTHCERSGKPHLWIIFEELVLADEFRGRRSRTRAELIAQFGIGEPHFLDNCLTTAKRAFRRFVLEVIPPWPADDVESAGRFAEWMEALRDSNASQFDLLHLAYSVAPFLGGDASQAASAALVVGEARGVIGPCCLVPADRASDPCHDELSILLSFRLEMPLHRILDVAELDRYIPASCPYSPCPRGRPMRGEPGLERPLCLLTFIEPNEAESAVLAEVDVIGLLGRLKSWAKQLRRRSDHAIPEAFAELIYTVVNVVALVRYRSAIHSIGSPSLASNVRWFLGQPWLDRRLRPLLEAGLVALERPSP
jgi:DNA-directed RNA polymerase specialized sigma24 family protein